MPLLGQRVFPEQQSVYLTRPFPVFFLHLHTPLPTPCPLPPQSPLLTSPCSLSSFPVPPSEPRHWLSPSNHMIIWHNVTPADAWWGAASQLYPPPSRARGSELRRKKNGERGGMNMFREEKREFHAHVVTWPVFHRLICPLRVIPPLFSSSSGRSSPQLLYIWLPFSPTCARRKRTQ